MYSYISWNCENLQARGRQFSTDLYVIYLLFLKNLVITYRFFFSRNSIYLYKKISTTIFNGKILEYVCSIDLYVYI